MSSRIVRFCSSILATASSPPMASTFPCASWCRVDHSSQRVFWSTQRPVSFCASRSRPSRSV
jgi:hypothetical protein